MATTNTAYKTGIPRKMRAVVFRCAIEWGTLVTWRSDCGCGSLSCIGLTVVGCRDVLVL